MTEERKPDLSLRNAVFIGRGPGEPYLFTVIKGDTKANFDDYVIAPKNLFTQKEIDALFVRQEILIRQGRTKEVGPFTIGVTTDG